MNTKDFFAPKGPFLHELRSEPSENSAAARSTWIHDSSIAKGTITLFLSEKVQNTASEIIDCDEKAVHDRWKFLESTY